jgi:hypothetical protein
MARFTIEFAPDLVSADILVKILADAGMRVGVGDYRPQKGGPFGRFQII